MSKYRRSEVPTRVQNNNPCERNVVKSLILEYEHVLSQSDVTNMGTEQSVIKPSTPNSIVKQRIEKFNQIEKEFKKTTRSVSTYTDPVKMNKDFHRSKSVELLKETYNSNIAKSISKDFKENLNKQSLKEKNNGNSMTTKPLAKRSSKRSCEKPRVGTLNQESTAKTSQNRIDNSIQVKENVQVRIEDIKKQERCSQDEDIYTDEEFIKIENQLQDVTNAIFEMTEKIEPVYISTINNFVVTSCTGDNESEEGNHTDYNDTDSVENVDIYLSQRESFCNDSDNEFGEISKNDLQKFDFVEAYNQAGNELLMTTVHSVKETFVDKNDLTRSEQTLPNAEQLKSEEKLQEFVTQQNSDNDVTSGGDNVLYFSKEELEVLLPDDDYELHVPTFPKTVVTTEIQNTKTIPGCDLREVTVKNAYLDAIKSETTIYDSFQNPRIAKVRSITKREEFSKESPLKDDEEAIKAMECKPKIDYIIEELIETEKNYIDHLECVLEDYMPYFKSNNLAPRSMIRTLLGNLKDIYQLTQKLYRSLKGCTNYESIAKTFLRYEPLFEMYPLYFKNKPAADQYLMGEFKEILVIRERELNDQLGLASHLLTPIQRLGKYILFLDQINKELKKNDLPSDLVVMALNMVKKEMTTGNDYIAIDSIKKSPVGLAQQGSFLMREKFKVIKPKKYEAVMFFFEKILVFTTVHTKNPEVFVYKDSIKLNEMGIVTYDDQPLNIHLKRFPSGTKEPEEHNRYVIEAKREKDKKVWSEEIEKRLWEQLIKCRERQMSLQNCAKKKHLFEKQSDQARKKKAGRK